MSESVLLKFQAIDKSQPFTYATITLNRPEKANALNADMLERLGAFFTSVAEREECRFLVLRSQGKHFSAGADLQWMKESAHLSYADNMKDAERLSLVFEKLFQLEIPSIVLVQGSAYGGALGLISCCDFAIASDDSKFSLSEVKVGLLPAVILPYLLFKMPAATVRRVALTAEAFSAGQAQTDGLVDTVCPVDQMGVRLQALVKHILQGGPQAHKRLKRLLLFLLKEPQSWVTLQTSCYQTIAEARAGREGQDGLKAFLTGTKPPWVQSITDVELP